MLSRISIAKKLFLAFLTLTIVVITVASVISFRQSRDSLAKAAFDQLTSVREMKAFQIEDYLDFIARQVVTFSSDRMVIETMRELDTAFSNLGFELAPDDAKIRQIDTLQQTYYEQEFLTRLAPNLQSAPAVGDYLPGELNTRLLQHLYLSNSPYNTGSKDFLDDAGDGSTYSRIHREIHPVFREYLRKFGYYDIFLLDMSGGEIVYSVYKEVDVGTSLLDGPYADTGLARVFLAARNAASPDFVAIDDFEPYHPSYNAPAAFIASPIFDGDEQIGVLAFQMPIDRINLIMTNDQNWADVGLGESGETYIVADDFRLRNQSRFLIEDSANYFRMIEEAGVPEATIDQIRNLNSTIGLQEVRTEGTEDAQTGNTDARIFKDYRGVPVLSSYRPLEINGLNWVIMSEIDEAEAFAAIGKLARKLLLTALLLLAFALIAAMVFSRTITRPLARLGENSRALANGNLEVQIDTGGGDEIGDLARDFENMRLSLKKVVDELEELNAGLEQKVAERTAELEASERRIKAIIETANESILVANQDMELLLWNPAAGRLFGYSTEESRNRSILDIIPEVHRAPHEAGFAEAAQSGNLQYPGTTHELSALASDGREVPIELSLGTWEIGGKRYFSAVIRDITERKEMEHQIEQANKRMLEELNFAREIQMSMVPLLFPVFPERSELTLYAALEPAREVGGDFYDFYFLDDNQLCLVMADVAGKGAPAALFMAVSKTLIKSRAAHDFEPSSILTQVNGELSENNTTATFVTVFVAVLDISTGVLRYCNAGHNPPYVKLGTGGMEKLEELHGPVLGVMPGLVYSQDEIRLAPGDTLLTFTDGVTESMSEREEEYTDQRLENLIAASTAEGPQGKVAEILEDVRKHQGAAEQSDDITLLVIEYHGLKQEPGTRLELTIRNQLSEIGVVEERFQEFAVDNGIGDADQQTVSLVLDDLLNNVISYAFPEGGDHEIVIDLSLRGSHLVTTVEDGGIPFNPFTAEAPDTDMPLEERDIGGLGILLVRQMMDEAIYERRANRNVVFLVKKLQGLGDRNN